jgi:hypothetical protein
MKNLLFIVIALMVLLLAAGGEHANQVLKSRTEVTLNASDEDPSDSSIPADQVITSQIFNSVVQISHLIFHSDLISEFELPEITETKAHSVIQTALNFTKLYRTLFQIIISPNAP